MRQVGGGARCGTVGGGGDGGMAGGGEMRAARVDGDGSGGAGRKGEEARRRKKEEKRVRARLIKGKREVTHLPPVRPGLLAIFLSRTAAAVAPAFSGHLQKVRPPYPTTSSHLPPAADSEMCVSFSLLSDPDCGI
ncbi:hypothetical protein EJB05_09085, partial [Eragrostis curvula]